MRREDPKYVEKRKKFMAMQKEKSQDKFSKGGLKGNQKKLDKNNNNRIDAQDFKILKQEKAKGRGMGLQDEKVQPGKVMKAKRGDFMERRKQLMGINSVMPKVGSGPKAGRSGLGKLGKAGRLGVAGAVLGAAGAGAAKLGQTIGRKLDKVMKERKARKRDEAKVKKMGGGMMNKPMGYSKGGGYDAGVPGKVRDVVNKYTRVGSRLFGERLTKRDMDMLKEVGTKKISKMFGSKKFSKGGGADTGTIGEAKSKLATIGNPFKRQRPKLEAPKRAPMKPLKKMGGGMIGASQRPGYSKGTMVMARGCKLGRKKATKIT